MEYSNFCMILANTYFLLGFTNYVNCQFFVDPEVDIWLDDLSDRAAEEYEVALRSIPRTFSYTEEMRMKKSLNHMIEAVGRVKSVLDHHLSKFTGDKSTLACVRRNLQKTVRVLENKVKRQQQKRTAVNWAEAMTSTLEVVGRDLIFKGLKSVKDCLDIRPKDGIFEKLPMPRGHKI